jgi:hypothetical protein
MITMDEGAPGVGSGTPRRRKNRLCGTSVLLEADNIEVRRRNVIKRSGEEFKE